MRAEAFVLCCLICAFVSGCSEKTPEVRTLPERSMFIAMERDFQGFHDWGSQKLGDKPARGETHPAGKQRAFVNALPANGAKTFPIGTIIVKESEGQNDAGQTQTKFFAMVKRGGGYNTQGAQGWEWFELKERSDGSFAIGWRGIDAPEGEEYNGDPSGTCNSCHLSAIANDYVKASALALALALANR